MIMFPWWNDEFGIALNVFAHAMVLCGTVSLVGYCVAILRQAYVWITLDK